MRSIWVVVEEQEFALARQLILRMATDEKGVADAKRKEVLSSRLMSHEAIDVVVVEVPLYEKHAMLEWKVEPREAGWYWVKANGIKPTVVWVSPGSGRIRAQGGLYELSSVFKAGGVLIGPLASPWDEERG